jgi:hypothetical protein
MKREFMITITPIDGASKEIMGTTRTVVTGSDVSEERTVDMMHKNLHDGLDWLKGKLTKEAVHRLLYGLPEEVEPVPVSDVSAYVAEDVQFSVDFEVSPYEDADDYAFHSAQMVAANALAAHIIGAGHETKDFVFANLPLPAVEGMKRYRHAARRRPWRAGEQ